METTELVELSFTPLSIGSSKIWLETKEILLIEGLIGYVDYLWIKRKRLTRFEKIDPTHFVAFYQGSERENFAPLMLLQRS